LKNLRESAEKPSKGIGGETEIKKALGEEETGNRRGKGGKGTKGRRRLKVGDNESGLSHLLTGMFFQLEGASLSKERGE